MNKYECELSVGMLSEGETILNIQFDTELNET